MLDKQSSTIQQRWTQSSGPSKSKSKLSNKCLKYQLSDCLTDINLVIDVTSSTGKVSVFRRSRTHQIFSAKHLSSFEQFEPLLVCTNSVKSLVYLCNVILYTELYSIHYTGYTHTRTLYNTIYKVLAENLNLNKNVPSITILLGISFLLFLFLSRGDIEFYNR